MSRAGPNPAGGRERRIDPAALPDPALFTGRSAHRAAMRRIAFTGAALVAAAAVAALGLRGVFERVGAARRAAVDATAAFARTGSGQGRLEQEPEAPRPISPSQLAELQQSWVGSESIAPRAPRVDQATGEQVLPFHGFGVQVDTTPPGARVLVDGEEMGTSPLLSTVSCQPGEVVRVQAARADLAASVTTRCRKDLLVKLALTLRRGG